MYEFCRVCATSQGSAHLDLQSPGSMVDLFHRELRLNIL